MEEKEKRKKGKERGKAGSENIREGIPSAPVLSDFVQDCDSELASDTTSNVPDCDISSENALLPEEVQGLEPELASSQKDDDAQKPSCPQLEEKTTDTDPNNLPQTRAVENACESENNAENSELAIHQTESSSNQTYSELNTNLHQMEPHFFLNKELEGMRNLELQEDNVQPSAPLADYSSDNSLQSSARSDGQCRVPSAPMLMPSAPPTAESCTTSSSYEPVLIEHNVARHPLSESEEPVLDYGEETRMEVEEPMTYEPSESEYCMTPFTDSQLHTLYHNVELEKNQEFVTHWLHTQQNIEKYELDELLTNYQRVRLNLLTTKKQVDSVVDKIDNLQKGLWQMSKERVEEEGDCECGVQVTAVKEKTLAEFSPETARTLRTQFKQARELLGENYALFNFRSELCRLKVEEFIHQVLERVLSKETSSTVFTPQEELRLTVSVLFKYLRKDLQDEKLGRDLRLWLDRTIGVVLTNSTLYDHLFILNHIMRCPAGVGKWAASYVQPAVPLIDLDETTFDNPFLDHLITILATLLLPVRERSSFIQEFKLRAKNLAQLHDGREEDSIWTVLDGEGSEDEDPEESWSELREADLIGLLNQIPVHQMFRYVLRIEERDGKDQYDVTMSSQQSILKLYAFSTQFVYLLREGLKTFNTPRYRQFAKRLGRLIRHTVHYVSDHWENFKNHNKSKLNTAMFQRLQLEYDCFFLRATKCIFSSLKLGIWQYLADIPYGTISAGMLWRIFYVLHLDYQEESHSDFGSEINNWMEVLSSPDLQIQFEEKCSDAEESELFFLLSAFANMAMSRKKEEDIFIKRSVMDLFYIGFVSESTRDANCKNCRDLLSMVCQQHPFILSHLIQILKVKIGDIGKLSTYLVQEMPWKHWKPLTEDLETLFKWLKYPISSAENASTRIVLSKMNWEFGYLSKEDHIATAIVVAEAFIDYSTEISSQGIVNTSVNTMSNLAMATISTSGSLETQFCKWCWEMISKLRLHMMDQSLNEYDLILSGNPDIFKQLQDFDLSQPIERVVSAAVSKNAIACYTVLMLTQVGHSLPEVLERGLGFLKVILDSGRFDHTMELLSYLLPLFLIDNSAIDHGQLIYILSRLVNADQTYLSLAKTIITGMFPGPVTKEMGNMIHRIISNFDNISSYSRKDILELLTRMLTSISNWSTNTSVLYLLDIVCSYAFNHKVCYWSILKFYEDLHEQNNKKASSGGIFSLFSSLGSQSHNLTLSSGYPQFGFLLFFVLQAEDNYMQKTGLWRAIIGELSSEKTLEEALTEAGKKTEVNPPSSSQLIIYRWAQQGMDIRHDHPASFVFWQRFFMLYLSRPAELVNGQEVSGVGMKFFSGMINSLYYSKIKASIKSSIDFFEKQLTEDSDSGKYEDLSKLYRTYYIWIDDPKLMDSSLYTPALSPVFDPARLVKILSMEKHIWIEFLDVEKMDIYQNDAVADWDKLHFRYYALNDNNTHVKSAEESPEKRIISRLHSYDPSLPAPPLRHLAKPVPVFPNFTTPEALTLFLDGPLTSLNDFSENQCNNISAYGSLNCSYLETIVNLWSDEEVSVYATVACPGSQVGKEKVACSGPALINLSYYEARKQEGVAVKVETNRKEHAEVEHQILSAISPKYVIAAAVLNNIIQKTLKSFEKDLGKGVSSLHLDLATQLFCCLAKSTTENWLSLPPLRHFISECLENLATIVVSQGECQAGLILNILKDSPHLSSILTSHFFPRNPELLYIYTEIGQIPTGDGSLSFVLLSKLDIKDWLASKPTDKEILCIIDVIFRNLEITGISPEANRLMVHGLHKKHLSQILLHQFPMHYLHILKTALNLSGSNLIDPDVFFDIINSVMGPGYRINSGQDADEAMTIIGSFAEKAQHDNPTVLGIMSEVAAHFEKDRLKFGLYGLYPKYRSYMKPLSYLFNMLCLQVTYSDLSRNQGTFPSPVSEYLWRNIKTVYDPWLSPINPASKSSTATWIQQLSDENASLMPWIPGDSSLAKLVLDSMTHTLKIIIGNEEGSTTLSNVLGMYSAYYATAGIKDHIFGVVHPGLSCLPWSTFCPNLGDIDAMMKIISMFLPQCHAFMGTIFVQIDWIRVVTWAKETPEAVRKVVPSLFCLMIKLSSEPSVRQSGRLLSIVTQSELWAWQYVDFSHYEALAQWYVMSVDCRCIVKHKERNPLDAAIIRLFLTAAEFNASVHSTNTERKQKIWVKCCAKLLSSVCSKQKNFLSINQPALHTTLRKLLEDMDKVATKITAGPMVKDYLTIFNTTSSSVLPGSALVVTQSWLVHASSTSLLIHAFMDHATLTIKDAKLASSVLEATVEAYFKEEESKPSWNVVQSQIKWPTGTKVKELLEASVSTGNCLVLFSYVDLKHGECLNSQEEQVLASSLLDYLRQLQSCSVPGLEPKLPLLYTKLVNLLHRQVEYSKESSWAVNQLVQLTDILTSIAEQSPGWGQNLLGAIGLGSQDSISLRGKFLARALAVFIRSLLSVDKTSLFEKRIETGEQSTTKALTLNTPEMKTQLDKLKAFKSNKGFSGFHELVGWVMAEVEREPNTLADTVLFIRYLTIDKLYTELYLRMH